MGACLATIGFELLNPVQLAIIGALFGSFFGSFYNVVIYRVPLSLSVNKPARSFCPSCKEQIPAWRNIPIFTWLIQGGKAACCHTKIAFRYVAVEFVVAALFAWAFVVYPPEQLVVYLAFYSILLIISIIDIKHYIIPVNWTWGAAVIAVIAAGFNQMITESGFMHLWNESWWSRAGGAILDGLVCVSFLWGIAILGRLAFGRLKWSVNKQNSEKPLKWHIKQSADNKDIILTIKDAAISKSGKNSEAAWSDIFTRNKQRIIMQVESLKINLNSGVKAFKQGQLEIYHDRLEWSDINQNSEAKLNKEVVNIEDIKDFSGESTFIKIPREAMGEGDIHLLGMLGMFLGWQSGIFIIIVASFIALIFAILARFKMGHQLPFGPFLASAAVIWVLGGEHYWQLYLALIGFN